MNNRTSLTQRLLLVVIPLIVALSFALLLGILIEHVSTTWRPYDGYRARYSSDEDLYIVISLPPGPAADAGLREDDRIRLVNGLHPRDISATAGDHDVWNEPSQTIVVVRDGLDETITFELWEAPPWRVWWPIFSNFLPLGIIMGLALYTWRQRPFQSTSLIYFAMFFLLQLAVVTNAATDIAQAVSPSLGAVVSYIQLVCLLTMPICSIQLHLRLGYADSLIARRSMLLNLIPLGFLVAGFFDHQGNEVVDLSRQYVLALYGTMLVALTAAVALLCWLYFRRSGSVRKQLRFILTTTMITFGAIATLIVLMLAEIHPPTVNETLWWIVPMPIGYSLAIFHDGLWEQEKRLNRAIVHSVLLLLLITFYTSVTRLVAQEFATTLTQQPLFWGLATLLVAMSFVPLRNFIGGLIDRLLYGGWYDYRTVVNELGGEFAGVVDEDTLGSLLVDRLGQLMHLKDASLWLNDGHWRQIHAVGNGHGIAFTPAFEAGLIAQPQPTDYGEKLCVPIVRNEALLGTLLLGDRIGTDGYDSTDRQILQSVANQAAVSAENVRLVNTLRQRADEINQLYEEVVNSREAERQRLARDLHDQALQDVISIKYLVQLGFPETELHRLEGIQQQVERAVSSLRTICTDLRPPALDTLGLESAIQALIDRLHHETDLRIKFSVRSQDGIDESNVPDAIAICLYRVFQEAMSNVRRHAQATKVDIRLSFTAREIRLAMADDGIGLAKPVDFAQLMADKHYGLAGMQERLQLLGGRLTIDSAAERGTTLTATLPLSS